MNREMDPCRAEPQSPIISEMQGLKAGIAALESSIASLESKLGAVIVYGGEKQPGISIAEVPTDVTICELGASLKTFKERVNFQVDRVSSLLRDVQL